jgi:hypothetical protein
LIPIVSDVQFENASFGCFSGLSTVCPGIVCRLDNHLTRKYIGNIKSVYLFAYILFVENVTELASRSSKCMI